VGRLTEPSAQFAVIKFHIMRSVVLTQLVVGVVTLHLWIAVLCDTRSRPLSVCVSAIETVRLSYTHRHWRMYEDVSIMGHWLLFQVASVKPDLRHLFDDH
jgi:hypothetical protein